MKVGQILETPFGYAARSRFKAARGWFDGASEEDIRGALQEDGV